MVQATNNDTADTTHANSGGLSRHARRLLEVLSVIGAAARESDVRTGFLAVAAPKGRITSVLASLPLAAGAALVDRGYAVWRDRVLLISPDGRSALRRLSTSSGGDPLQDQHRDLARETRDAGETPLKTDASESPVTWLARRRDRDGRPFLDAAAIEAGERFRRDVTVAQLLPSVTSNWSAHGAGSRGDPAYKMLPSEVALAARQRVDRALDALGGEFAGLVLDACGFVKKLETIETERGWPARSAKIVLRMALMHLAKHYGLATSASGPAVSRGLRHWGADDYRPAITPSETDKATG